MKRSIFFYFLILIGSSALAQQRPDTSFVVKFDDPLYDSGGPVVCIDAAHHNFHTMETGFAPFAKVLKLDGFRIRSVVVSLKKEDNTLGSCDIFVIANALHESNINNWILPNPSAFTETEIEYVNEWVRLGGRLFLIADHMPFAGAADALARSFGFEYNNGFATLQKQDNQPDLFSIENGRLIENNLPDTGIISVTSFTGSAFRYPPDALPVMQFKEGDFSLEPETAWQFSEETTTTELTGFSQGAIVGYGKGKLAVFGEAAMFTAQIIDTPQGEFRIGLNNKEMAPHNLEFLRSLLKWLAE